MEKLKILLSSIVVALFVGNYQICEFFYKEDVNKWWILRTNIYSLMFAVLFYVIKIESRGFFRFILSIGVGLSFSDVIDRLYFNSNVFNYSDIFMIIITVSIAAYEYAK